MNILYIAYSCSPYHGSEDKIGWNIPLYMAKRNRVYVITKEEQRKFIEEYLTHHSLDHIQFYYVDIPTYYKKIFKGAFYSGRLNLWHKRAFVLAKEICRREKIDLIHQITPVEFRSIGSYAKIPNVKFVCGPVAGGQNIPKGLETYSGKHFSLEWLRQILNRWYVLKYSLNRKLRDCDYLYIANDETKAIFGDRLLEGIKHSILVDICADSVDVSKKTSATTGNPCRFLVVGRLVYLKGHKFLLDAFRDIPKNLAYVCRFVGEGPEYNHVKGMIKKYGLGANISVDGSVPYTEMSRVYGNADVLILPSLREASGSVILEAMVHGLPIITIDQFGGAVILDESCAWLYSGRTKQQYLDGLRSCIVQCIAEPEEVAWRGDNARRKAMEFTWEKRCETYQNLYAVLITE